MPHLYAAAASPLGSLLASGEGPKTTGPKAVFAVVLMFGILCGGVFMLLASSFGAKVGYLITGTAFWGCWLVLGVLWLTGVPKVPMPFNIPDIPESTPRYTGPEGTAPSWALLDTDEERRKWAVPEGELVPVDVDELVDQNTAGEVQAGRTTIAEGVAKHYADELGVPADRIVIDQVVTFTDVQMVRQDRRVQWLRMSTGPAQPNASATKETLDLIARVQPETFDAYFLKGSEATPTYVALGVFGILFFGHLVLLGMTDASRADRPVGAPERIVTA